MSIVDVHAHVVFEETLGLAGEHGPVLTEQPGQPATYQVGAYCLHGVKYRDSAFMDVDLRLAQMRKAGIDFQVLSPNPLSYFHFIDEATAIGFCRTHNDALAALIAEHTETLSGLAALPMQNIAAAIAELQRSVKELGLSGACIGADIGIALDDETLDPFYEAVVALDVPLFIHPAPAGVDGPLRDERLRRFDLDLILGFAVDETLTVAALLYGGVLERHPALDVCISHGGGAAPYLHGRMAAAARTRPWSPANLRRDGAYEEMLSRLWFDSHLCDARAFELLRTVAGPQRLVYGTNFAGWDQAHAVFDQQTMCSLSENGKRLLRMTDLH